MDALYIILTLFAVLTCFIISKDFPKDPRKLLSEKEARLVDLFVAVAKCDRIDDPKEVLFIKSYICSSPQLSKNHEEIIECLDAELKNTSVRFLGYEYDNLPLFIIKRNGHDNQRITEKVSDLVTILSEKYFHHHSERMELLDVLFQIAYSQTGVSDVEVDLLREVAHYLDIKSWNFTSFLYKYEYLKREQQEQQKQQKQQKKEEPNRSRKERRKESREKERQKAHETRFENVTNTRTKEALQLLEISENADEQEIKSAYRRLVKMCHPDKLPADISEKEKEEAVERFRSIHEAYNFLLKMEEIVKK